MSYQKTAVRTWNENILFSALVELTYRCNLDCVFCYNDLGLQGRPMTLDDYQRFFGDLASLSCLHLTLSGGEPLVHPQFFEIAAKGRDLGFVLRIKSNGHSLRGRTLRRLKEEIDPFVVEVSLHGASAGTHDRQTRVAGSFERLLANFEEMSAEGLRFKINSTLTRWNESEIEGMFALAERFGAPLTVDPDVTPRDDGDLSPLDLSATPEGLRRLFSYGRTDDVVRQADAELPTVDSKKHCGAGSSGIAVDPFGNVYPCVQWRRPVGNLHERSIRDIWSGNAKLDEVRELSEEVKRNLARGGPGMFCPGTAEGLTGSPIPGLPLHPSSMGL
ncbi:MAG TPA: radical SAM protein [Vicinamibacteria bacterium]|nr:radical SAM protein [Vicinamibacteria bacterium]